MRRLHSKSDYKGLIMALAVWTLSFSFRIVSKKASRFIANISPQLLCQMQSLSSVDFHVKGFAGFILFVYQRVPVKPLSSETSLRVHMRIYIFHYFNVNSARIGTSDWTDNTSVWDAYYVLSSLKTAVSTQFRASPFERALLSALNRVLLIN